jgi:hypothetical protein
MKYLLLFFFTIISTNSLLAESNIDFEKLIKPKKLGSINWYNVEAFDVYYKALGKESNLEKDDYYYEVSGIKYPLSIHKKEKSNKIKRIYYRLTDKKIEFKKLKEYIKKNGFNKIKAKPENEFQYFVNKKKKIKLKFSNINQTLYAVEKWY